MAMKTCHRVLGLALLALWAGCADFDEAEKGFCERNPERCEVIRAKVVLATKISATCVLLEIRDASSHNALGQQWLPRTGDSLETAVPQGSLPPTVELAARPFLDGDCKSGQAARTPNG